ncbi:MAG: hypothetical protein QM500_08990, partial [Methylococcales bacterium]
MQSYGENATREKKTEEQYLKRTLSDIKTYKKETTKTVDTDDKAKDFVNWMILKKSTMSKSYWRQRKSSYVFYLTENGFIKTLKYLKSIGSDGCYTYKTKKDRIKYGKTSARKEKKLSKEDETLIYK